MALVWAAKILPDQSPCLTQRQLWNEKDSPCHRIMGTSNEGPRNPVLGVGPIIIIIEGFLSLETLDTESSYMPKESSRHFIQRWFYSESLLCQTWLARGGRKWLEALNTAPCFFWYCVLQHWKRRTPTSLKPTQRPARKLRRRTSNSSGCPCLQIPSIWHDSSLGLLLGRWQMH